MIRRLSIVLTSAIGVGFLALCLTLWLGAPAGPTRANVTPSTAFIRKEFRLNAEQAREFERVESGYRPHWLDLTNRLEASETRLSKLIESSHEISPEVESALQDFETLRAEAQRSMLRHVYEVSRIMPPAEAQRYVTWMGKRITEDSDAFEPPDDRR